MNIRHVLRALGVKYHEPPMCSAGWISTDCPWCGKPGKPGLGIHVRSLRTNCWSCGPHSIHQLLWKLCPRDKWASIRDELSDLHSNRSETAQESTGIYREPIGVGPLLEPHKRYLRGRGFDPGELVEKWGIGGIGAESKLGWRVFIPITVDGKRVTWSTRAIGDVEPSQRYRGATRTDSTIPRGDVLYGIGHCRNSVIAVEGFFDVYRIGYGACCTCGISYTRPQIMQLSRFSSRAICFDNEPGAQRRARKLCDELSVFPGTTTLVQLDCHDPGVASDDDVRELRREFLT